MVDSNLSELARQIYEKHRRALDFIFEHRPDAQLKVFDFFVRMIEKEDKSLDKDRCSKSYLHFVPVEWSRIDSMKGGSKEWTSTERILMFEIRNYEKLQLALVIGPGEQKVREKIFQHASANRKIFKPSSKQLTPKWAQIWEKTFLTKKEIEEGDWQMNWERIEKCWATFVESELPSIRDAIAGLLTEKR